MVSYPYVVFSEYKWLVSTYRPPELGSAEIDILELFGHGRSQSAYDILKVLKKRAKDRGKETSPGYKDVHKRVKRLVELKLIYQIEEHFERAAKHYRITPYGLITTVDRVINEDWSYILYNKDNIVYRSLLEFLEDETVDTFPSLKGFPATVMAKYFHDCCAITADICRSFWHRSFQAKIKNILPPDDIIQKYLSWLDGRPVEEHVLNELTEYERRLTESQKEDRELANEVNDYNERVMSGYYDNLSTRAPYPLLELYKVFVVHLGQVLEDQTRFFALSFVTQLGKDSYSSLVSEKRPLPISFILKDKKFIELVNVLKGYFDVGYDLFESRK